MDTLAHVQALHTRMRTRSRYLMYERGSTVDQSHRSCYLKYFGFWEGSETWARVSNFGDLFKQNKQKMFQTAQTFISNVPIRTQSTQANQSRIGKETQTAVTQTSKIKKKTRLMPDQFRSVWGGGWIQVRHVRMIRVQTDRQGRQSRTGQRKIRDNSHDKEFLTDLDNVTETFQWCAWVFLLLRLTFVHLCSSASSELLLHYKHLLWFIG